MKAIWIIVVAKYMKAHWSVDAVKAASLRRLARIR
jgi:hypothetical protein